MSDHFPGSSLSAVRRSEAPCLRRPRLVPPSRPKESPSPPRLCRLHLTDRFRFAKRPKSIYFSTNERAGNGRDGVWATRVTSGARPVLVDAGGRRGQERQEGAEERKEEKGKLLGADPEVGYWAKPQASTPLQHPHHPPHPHESVFD